MPEVFLFLNSYCATVIYALLVSFNHNPCFAREWYKLGPTDALPENNLQVTQYKYKWRGCFDGLCNATALKL